MRGEVDALERLRVQLAAQRFGDRTERAAGAPPVEVGHRQIDRPRVAIVAARVNGQPRRRQEQLGRARVQAAVVVEADQRQPELAPGRDGRDAARLRAEPSPGLRRQGRFGSDAEQPERDVAERGDEHEARGFRMKPPRALAGARALEVPDDGVPRGRVQGASDDAPDDDVLRGDHRAPDHLALPVAALSLKRQQVRDGSVERSGQPARGLPGAPVTDQEGPGPRGFGEGDPAVGQDAQGRRAGDRERYCATP